MYADQNKVYHTLIAMYALPHNAPLLGQLTMLVFHSATGVELTRRAAAGTPCTWVVLTSLHSRATLLGTQTLWAAFAMSSLGQPSWTWSALRGRRTQSKGSTAPPPVRVPHSRVRALTPQGAWTMPPSRTVAVLEGSTHRHANKKTVSFVSSPPSPLAHSTCLSTD